MTASSAEPRSVYLWALGEVMGWNDEEAQTEFRWLNLMAEMKYDAYRDFQAGMRFVASLVRWLQQFEPSERSAAYRFVRERLVFIGLSETHHLVEQFYPKVVHPQLIREIATREGVLPYRIQNDPARKEEIERSRRRSLFLGLSDGARIDVLRHSNVGRLTNEQIVGSIQLDKDKWSDLLGELQKNAPGAQFERVFLIDDFTATGTSFLRWDAKKGRWAGKLQKFRESVENSGIAKQLFAPGWQVHVHHLIASASVVDTMRENEEASRAAFASAGWSQVQFSYGTVLPVDLPVAEPADAEFIELARKYYNPKLQTGHSAVGGVTKLDLGYGGCALPLVLEHNTPNNSVALLWAEHDADDPRMVPLFRRRQRHM